MKKLIKVKCIAIYLLKIGLTFFLLFQLYKVVIVSDKAIFIDATKMPDSTADFKILVKIHKA